MIRRFGAEAYTAGFKVTTTLDSRLQKAANRAMHNTLLAYDERHGYRGPLAHVDLPASATTEHGSSPSRPSSRALLDDYPSVRRLRDRDRARGGAAERARVLRGPRRANDRLRRDVVGRAVRERRRGRHEADVRHRGAQGRRHRALPSGCRPAIGGSRRFPRSRARSRRSIRSTAALVALTGGFDFFLSNYNRATQAKRQPGSSFKPFVYSAALQNGFTPATIVNDSPPEGEYQAELERVWRPENFNDKYFGFVSLRFALQESLNAVSIRITKAMGVPTVARYARKFGFDDTAIPNNLSIALGAGGIAPLDLVTGYATFANGGYRVDHYFIQRIANAAGEVVYEAKPAFVCADCGQPPPAAAPDSCARPPAPPPSAKPEAASPDVDLTNLNAVAPRDHYAAERVFDDRSPQGRGARRYGREGEQGVPGAQRISPARPARRTRATTRGSSASTRDVVAAAWVGFDQDRSLGGREQGGVTAIPMWIDYMREALANEPEHTLARPVGIVEYRINPTSGLIANDATRDTVFEKFDIDNVPAREPDQGFVSPDSTTPSTTPARAGDPLFD